MLFDKAIRIGSVDDKFPDYYVLFSPDGKLAHLYSDNGKKHETLERRFLPKGGYVWNVEDDDTKNLRYKNGVWTIEKRMQRIGSSRHLMSTLLSAPGKRNTMKAYCRPPPAWASATSSRYVIVPTAVTEPITSP